MDQTQQTFLRLLLACGALQFGDFVLKSGRQSPYFINIGRLNTGDAVSAAADAYAKTIKENVGLGFDVVFGPAYKGIPLAVATSEAIWRLFAARVAYCSDRKEEKDHGDRGSTIGSELKEGARVVYVDDVISAGTSLRNSLRLLHNYEGVELVGAVVAVDREERGTRSLLTARREIESELGMPVHAILQMRGVVEFLNQSGKTGKKYVDHDVREAFYAYLRRYGTS